MNKLLNIIGEFKDKDLENEYFKEEMKSSVRYLKPLLIFLILLNTFFIISDFIFMPGKNSFLAITLFKILYSFLVLVLYVYISNTTNYINIAKLLTIYEILAVFLVAYNLNLYKAQDYLVQTCSVILFLTIIYLVPNRWIYVDVVSVLTTTTFAVISLLVENGVPGRYIFVALSYTIAIKLLCSVFALQIHCNKRMQYIANKELVKLSITDPLTGIFNRVKVNEMLYDLDNNKSGKNPDFCLAIFDFDNFKLVNDNYGHIVGDKVIVQTTQLINNNIKEEYIFARWGGEEFVILMPDTSLHEAAEIIDHLRELISITEFEKVGTITCSFGLVQYQPNDNYESILHRADKKLYEAKAMGKNVIKF